MKKIALLFVLFFVCFALHAQKKNGIVYSEHEYIDNTRACWKAFANGDKDAFLNYFTDSVNIVANGNFSTRPKTYFNGVLDWWAGIDNLTIEDDSPAYPDAIDYDEGGIWVQDWLRIKGTHKKTGINIDFHLHNLYAFNEGGKINTLIQYYDDSFFEEIANSQTAKENGKVYINHPYIVIVRKAINAVYLDKDVEKWEEFYSPDAIFSASPMKWGESIDLETKKEQLNKMLSSGKKFEIKQIGYPDCIYYAKNDNYVVYSWWTVTEIDGDRRNEIPIMVSHSFDKDGKIEYAFTYYSTNHYD